MHGAVGLEAVILDLLVLLIAAVLVLLVSHRLRVSSVVGLLVTGMLIGPSGLRFIDREAVELYAELGVVLLLFTVGLEVSLVRLRRQWRDFLFGGGGQVILTLAAGAGIASAFGAQPGPAVFLGCLAALSSTAIVLKIYTDRQELQSPQGQLSAGILLFQDFCLAPMIFLVPVLAQQVDTSAFGIVARVSLGLSVVAVSFVAARTIMPRILEWIVGTRMREMFVLGVLAICFTMSMITAEFGFSLALGAFLAGLIISESHYSHQVIVEILPLRDVFNSLFFIAVGMLLDLSEVGRHFWLVLGVGTALFLTKASIAALVTGWLGYTARVAVIVGLSLGQIGEFSLVLAGVGREFDLLQGAVFHVFLGAAILTMLFTPILIELAPRFADRAPRVRLPRPLERARLGTHSAEVESRLEGHVIVVGYGLNGRNLSRVLASTGLPFVVLELNATSVRQGRKAGHPVLFGDATRAEILTAQGIARANMLVVGIADLAASRRIVRVARDLNPNVHILVRTRAVTTVDELRELGANEVIPEEFETSIEIFSRVLECYHVPRNVIRTERRIIRDEGYDFLRSTASEVHIASERVAEIVEAALTETFLVRKGSPADGSTLRELDLRHQSGVTVIAVVREGGALTNPSPDLRFQPNDNLVLVGGHAALEVASEILEGTFPESTSAPPESAPPPPPEPSGSS